jgi:hypothetical protein
MKKLFLLVLAFAVTAAFAMPAMATNSRVAALGGYGRYLEDDYNIFEWPATLPSYANVVWIELELGSWEVWADEGMPDWGYEVTPVIGASYALGEDGAYGTLAMFFHGQGMPLNPFADWDSPGWATGDPFTSGLDSKFTVLYGYSMEGFSLGLFFSRADASSRSENGVEVEESDAYTKVGVGVRFDIGDAAYADVSFDLGMGSIMSESIEVPGEDPSVYFEGVTEDASKMYGIKGRLFYEWNETITWVPYFSWRSFDFSLKGGDDTYDYTDYFWGDKGMMFELGIGANIMVNEDNMILFAIEPFSYMKREPSEVPEDEDDYEWKATVMPRFILGLETDIKEWLTFRMGGVHELTKTQTTAGDEVETETFSDFAYYMGLGFHIGDWDVDCQVSETLPFHLGYWLTGYIGNFYQEPVGMISAKYHF